VSADARFQPPGAVVADVDGGLSRTARGALVAAAFVHLWLFSGRPWYILWELTSTGSIPPIGGLALLAGLACLYVGIGLVVATRTRGARFMLASIVLQSVGALICKVLFFGGDWHLSSVLTFLLPMLLGFGLAVVGWAVAPGRHSVNATGSPAP